MSHQTSRIDVNGVTSGQVPSIFFTDADLIEECPALKDSTHSFECTQTCRDFGLQLFLAANWRPDCAQTQQTNAQ